MRVGILTAAHLHVWGYAHAFKSHPETTLVGIWDDEIERGEAFAQKTGIPFVGFLDDLLDQVDAVVITSENTRHAELTVLAAQKGKHILCEKPLVTTESDAQKMTDAVTQNNVKFMTAFPCRFSPAFERLQERVQAGEIGAIKAICATNRGRCPFDWFVDKEKSGGGAMIDHVVHVTDLLRALLKEEPKTVQAQTGSNMYGQNWDDTAMVTMEFPSGIFATLDSSWSRPPSFKTWGDVTMNVIGETGVIELDMFGQALQVYTEGPVTHTMSGTGSDLDGLLVADFVRACKDDRDPAATLQDGLQAARVAIAGYKSAANGQPVAL